VEILSVRAGLGSNEEKRSNTYKITAKKNKSKVLLLMESKSC